MHMFIDLVACSSVITLPSKLVLGPSFCAFGFVHEQMSSFVIGISILARVLCAGNVNDVVVFASPSRTGEILARKCDILQLLPFRAKHHDPIRRVDSDPEIPFRARKCISQHSCKV